ncbi:helix-turn-helix domain-containing protein [Trueperella pyogenes]|uniref:DNA-binding protein n=1 Tax=Trueperella pyogenes TaxID=1661 RepID=X4RER7_9ACTO|nr:helix-turn-helix domain-containing protein [Trueperella pyogenes]AHU90235.1 excisionase [Trueperella pyogenes]AJC69997.1 DNA-binding protein [Trueperella pyogenes TP8]AWA44300.1 DNA-binding protein [Trueperella pyogenes]AWG03204.1 DNA-binding protein [Trueperella pyogenes]AWG15933.1 DNA-binding protein [Trueperella pyogenes]
MSRFLTIADVAEYLNVSAGQVRTLIKNGELPAIQVGGRGQWRIEEAKLAEYVEHGYEITRQKIASGEVF